MAASVLPNTSAHFPSGSEAYSTNMYQGYTSKRFRHQTPSLYTLLIVSGYDGYPSEGHQNYIYSTEQPQMQYTSGDNNNNNNSWASQASTLRRVSSRSPSMQHERTPIRHHKPSVSRSRSASKSDALLAYATEQSAQSQQHSTSTTPSLVQSTPSSSPGMFNAVSYTSPAMASSFPHQNTYYDNSSPQFAELHGATSTHNHSMSDYITGNRTDLQMQPMLGTNLNPHEAMYLQAPASVRSTQMSALQPSSIGYVPLPRPLESTPGAIEVSSSRNKPQCWDHGCNGRQFSTFSNLLRHQREKSGTATKAKCPHCGTEFTRTTARNGHMYGGKCKGMPDAARRSSGSGDGLSDVEGQLQG